MILLEMYFRDGFKRTKNWILIRHFQGNSKNPKGTPNWDI